MTHTEQYLLEVQEIAKLLPEAQIESLVAELVSLRDRGGRLFLVGLGGSAANCSHAVNDFRRLCGIDATTPVDNFPEFSAIANDQGWDAIFLEGWRKGDALFVLSVGGGTDEVSTPISMAVKLAGKRGLRVIGIVGRDGGQTKQYGDIVLTIPAVNPKHVTPHTESFQMVLLHLLVSHPALQIRSTKW